MDELAFSPETLRLRSCHDQGRRHLSDVFWVRSEQGELLAVRQSVLLYEDAEKKELLGLAYARPVKEAAAGGELPAEEDTNERRRGAPRQSRQAGGIVMTMEECYQKLGGNYAEVSERLPSLRLVENSSADSQRTRALKRFAPLWRPGTGRGLSGLPIRSRACAPI